MHIIGGNADVTFNLGKCLSRGGGFLVGSLVAFESIKGSDMVKRHDIEAPTRSSFRPSSIYPPNHQVQSRLLRGHSMRIGGGN